ncbi:hypothetical protein HUJ04_011257 [Dendroctonus ponderosae]|nr:hypothetical protein HUJ04_011257 [Dendroctonus ponderosae]
MVMNVGDHSGNQWISMFNDECQKVLGLSAQAAGELMANNDAFTDVIEQAQFQEFILKCRVKMETYNVKLPFVVDLSLSNSLSERDTQHDAFQSPFCYPNFVHCFVRKCHSLCSIVLLLERSGGVCSDEHCLKTVAVRVEPVNYAQYNANLIQSIKKLAGLSR